MKHDDVKVGQGNPDLGLVSAAGEKIISEGVASACGNIRTGRIEIINEQFPDFSKQYEKASKAIKDVDDWVKEIVVSHNTNEEYSPARDLIGRIMSNRCNNALNEGEPGRAETTTNYVPYGNNVGIDVIVTATVANILASRTYADLIGAVRGDIFKTGKYNPEIRVYGYGHLVQGINVGDYIDLNNVPDIVTFRGIILDNIDYETVRDFYYKRNPRLAIAQTKGIGNDVAYMAKQLEKLPADIDELQTPVKFAFRGLVEAHNIIGVYCHPIMVDPNNYR